jgi:eukaryotic-like serine/threonine-protein kinase
MKSTLSSYYEFGPFQLDFAQRLLFRDHLPMSLEPKVLETLLALVENRGQLIEKEALIRRVWPDTFVEEGNLTRNIHHLRKLLGKDGKGREYIETVPRRGYRFAAEVHRHAGEATEFAEGQRTRDNQSSFPSAAKPEGGPHKLLAFRVSASAEAEPVMLARGEGGAAQALEVAPASAKSAPVSSPVEAVSFSQTESSAASQVVAHSSPATDAIRQRIWVTISAGVVLLVAAATVLAVRIWRQPVAAMQSEARRLTTFAPPAAVTAAAISPDGNFLAYSNSTGLFIQTIDTGETSTVPTPDAQLEISAISWFPDGSKLLLAGATPQSQNWSLWMVSVLGASRSVKLGAYPSGFVTPAGAVVSPDGADIAFESVMGGGPGIWLLRPEGGEPTRVISFLPTDALGPLSWKDDHHLDFVRVRGTDGQESAILSCDIRNGQIETILSNPRLNGELAVEPDGHVIYGQSSDAGTPAYVNTDYWQIQADARTGKALGQPARITTWQESVRGLSASTHRNRIVFQRLTHQHGVSFGDLGAGNRSLENLRSLTIGEDRDDYAHAWTPDSANVLLESSRTGHWAIFKHPLNQATDEPVIAGPDDLYYPRVSPDGRWLLYIERPNDWRDQQPFSLMRMPLTGGLPELVLKVTGYARWGFRFNCPIRRNLSCVLAERQGKQIVFHTFDPVHGAATSRKEIARIDFDPAAPAIDWDLAPDGSGLAWVAFDQREARIHILYFAQPGSPVSRQTDVLLKDQSHVHGLTWSSDGRGWFVTLQFPDTWTLLFAGMQGDTHVLEQGYNRFAPWAVPSPDGRHLAISLEQRVSNVWMIENPRTPF